MADDSWDIDTIFDFHSCDTPYGMKDYVLEDLTPEQQSKLNDAKRDQIRTDQKYLAAHPEIRALIVMVLRLLMKSRPRCDVHELVGKYFARSSDDIREEISVYLEERGQILSVNSTIIQKGDTLRSPIVESIKEEELSDEVEIFNEKDFEKELLGDEEVEGERRESVHSGEKLCQEILDEILEEVFDELDVDESFASIASVGFPTDYEDHAVGSESEPSSANNSALDLGDDDDDHVTIRVSFDQSTIHQ